MRSFPLRLNDYRLALTFLRLLVEFAPALLLKALALALKLFVAEALRDALFRAPLYDLHLGLDAPLDLIDRGGLAGLLLRLHLIGIDLHRLSSSPDRKNDFV